MLKTRIEVIEIAWDGPYTPEQVSQGMDRPIDYGIYQIYGTHSVLGPETLLYIGQAGNRLFATRMSEHLEEWINWESSSVQVYLGRLGGADAMTEARWPEWNEQIDRAEKLLIYFCSPPYNSQGIKSLCDLPETLVLNLKRKHRLPVEVSNLSMKTCCGEPNWHEYGAEQMKVPTTA